MTRTPSTGLSFRQLKVALDTSTIFIYFLDPHIDIADPKGLQLFREEFNCKFLDQQLYHVNNANVDPEKAYMQAQAHKYFFETFILHSIKITLPFTPTNVPAVRNKVVAVEGFEIEMSSFIVARAIETLDYLVMKCKWRVCDITKMQSDKQVSSLLIEKYRMCKQYIGSIKANSTQTDSLWKHVHSFHSLTLVLRRPGALLDGQVGFVRSGLDARELRVEGGLLGIFVGRQQPQLWGEQVQVPEHGGGDSRAVA